MKILNVASGKCKPLDLKDKDNFIVNVDLGGFSRTSVCDIEKCHINYNDGNEIHYLTMDIFKFMDSYNQKFDKIVCYRFLEHVSFENVLGFIYLSANMIEINGSIEIIVPDFKRLAQIVLDENVNESKFEKNNIIATTEIVNMPSDPHASIWTEERLKHYFEYEERFKIDSIISNYLFDGRDIYLKMNATRI